MTTREERRAAPYVNARRRRSYGLTLLRLPAIDVEKGLARRGLSSLSSLCISATIFSTYASARPATIAGSFRIPGCDGSTFFLEDVRYGPVTVVVAALGGFLRRFLRDLHHVAVPRLK